MGDYAYLVRVPAAEQATILTEAETVVDLVNRADDDPEQVLDLDEWWAALNFVLTAEFPVTKQKALELGVSWDDDQLYNVLMGGEPAPAPWYEDARYLGPDRVAVFAAQLDEMTVADFDEDYEPDWLNDEKIPPGPWDESQRERMVNLCTALVAFYRTAAQNGEGVVFVRP